MNPHTTFDPKELADALTAVKPAVSTRSAVQALSGVLIRGEGCRVTLTTTDMNVAVQRRLDADVIGRFEILVNHAELSKAVKRFAKRASVTLIAESTLRDRYFAARRGDPALPAKQAIAAARDAHVGVTATDGQREITLRGLRMADFPRFDFDAGEPLLDAPGPELAGVLGRALMFAGRDETRPILTGARIDLEDEPLVVTTDSYRLGVFKLPAIVRSHCALTVDGFGLRVALKTIKACSAVSMRHEKRRYGGEAVFVQTDDCTWRLRIVDGQFPSWQQLMPDYTEHGAEHGADYVVRVPVGELREACETAVAFSIGNAPMRIQLNGGVEITGRTSDGPSFTEKLPGAIFMRHAGEDLEYGVNPEFMRDVAKVANNGSLDCMVLTPLRPIAFVDGDDRYLLMPIRLNV